MKILVMGLPSAGKTTFAQALKVRLEAAGKTVAWFNADAVRSRAGDLDFSEAGRLRQAERMRALAAESDVDVVICDFVAPLERSREVFAADWTVWLDTIDASPFPDTDRVFETPSRYDFCLTEKNAAFWAPVVSSHLLSGRRRPVFDWTAPTTQLLGRFQPWHAGHRALFDRAIEKTGQVAIMVRDCPRDARNPFPFEDAARRIRRDLEPVYQGRYAVLRVPNVAHISYGRDVGYTIAREDLGPEIEAISATKLRAVVSP